MTRFDYVQYDSIAIEQQSIMKQKFHEIEQLASELQPGRAQALIFTKLEEAYMWVGKAIRDDQIKRNGSAPLQESRVNS